MKIRTRDDRVERHVNKRNEGGWTLIIYGKYLEK
jgi:hypothetical protein